MTQDGPSIQLMIERGGLPPLRGFVAGRRPDGRPLGPEGLDVSGVHLRPALARPPGRTLAIQVAGEQIEALVPAGAVPGGPSGFVVCVPRGGGGAAVALSALPHPP